MWLFTVQIRLIVPVLRFVYANRQRKRYCERHLTSNVLRIIEPILKKQRF